MVRPKDSDESSNLPQRRRNTKRAKGHDESLSEPKDSDEGGVRPQRKGGGDSRRAQIEYLERKLGGGASPTPQAYARAARQWQHLSGAVRSMPVPNLTSVQAESDSTDANASQSASDMRDQEQQI